MENINKVFFTPGDLVTIKHDLVNKPRMLVIGKETKTIIDKSSEASHFKGIKCFWFTADHVYQEKTFSTKDLVHVEDK